MAFREEIIGPHRLILGDCREVLFLQNKMTENERTAIITDPPYPNSASHFADAIEVAKEVCGYSIANHWFTFWTEIEIPPVCLPLVAVHIWYRTNTNRPDNYEPIFEFHADGRKRSSRVMPHCVIFPGLTGIEASGHPTEKNPSLMHKIVSRTDMPHIVDPFMGSGTTGVACAKMGRIFTGIEREPRYFDIACRRIEEAMKQPDLFIEQPKAIKPKQADLFTEAV